MTAHSKPVQPSEVEVLALPERGAAWGGVGPEGIEGTCGWSWRDWLALGVIAAAGAAGLWWSWGTWPDVLIDFGRELYVPWRLAQGDVLYRDIAYFHGPLSPYLNALWFRLFGTSLLTLVVVNLVIMAGVLWLLYLILRTIAGRAAALLAGLTFIALFAYAQLVPWGNFNWLCPYSHEVTHASALSVLSIYLLYRYACRGRITAAAGSGLALGLVFLTKVEFFAAAALAAGCALILTVLLERPRWSVAARALGIWVALACLPAVGALLALSTVLPARQALIGTLGSWAYVFDTRLTSNNFYRWSMGINTPAIHLKEIAIWTAAYAQLLGMAAAAALVLRRPGRWAYLGAAGLFALVAVDLWYLHGVIPWTTLARSWPVLLLVLGLTTLLELWRQRREPQQRRILVLRLAMTVLSLALLLRMLLNVRFSHYGFVLTMPGTLMLLAAAFAWLPKIVTRFGGQAVVVRGAVLGMWLAAVVVYLQTSEAFYRGKKFPVGSGADRFAADNRGKFVSGALEVLQQHAQPGQTMAVIPEGVILNYLLRLRAPSPYTLFIPTDMQMHGEQRMLEAFRSNPPDWLVLIPRDVSEYGYKGFGVDYGQDLWAWLVVNYEITKVVAQPPLSEKDFRITIARRRVRP